MDNFSIQHNAPEIGKALQQRHADALRKIDSALHRGALELQREAQETMPKFRSETVTRTVVEDIALLEKHVAFGTRHAIYTERGTGEGGRPPLAEMLDWIRLKNIVPRTPGMTVTSLAHLLRRSIAEHGVPATHFAENALRNKSPRILQLVADAARTSMGTTP